MINKILFLLIGAGERTSSGIPKIYSGWKSANWRTPKLYEKQSPSEQTLLELSTVSLIPKETTELLDSLFGEGFYTLSELEQMIVTTAAIEGWINHERACQLTSKHSRDVTLTLPKLVDKGFLIASGEKKDKSYSLPSMEPPSPEEVFSNTLTSLDNLTHSTNNLTYDVKTGKYYYGVNRGMQLSSDTMNSKLADLLPEQTLNKYKLGNCAEVDAVNQALNDRANMSDLYMYTIDVNYGNAKAMCENCIYTFDDNFLGVLSK